MTWLIKLYPPAWRRRYGREAADLISTQPASFGTAIDLLAGAVDAWFNPQSSTAPAADVKGTGTMISKMLKLRCAGYGSKVTRADGMKAAAVTIGGSLALMAPLMWAMSYYGKNAYLESLMSSAWLLPFLFSQRYTELKGRSGRVQALLIGCPAMIVMAIALGSAWLASN